MSDHPPFPPGHEHWEPFFQLLAQRCSDIEESHVAIAALRAEHYRCKWLDEAEKWARCPVNDCKNFDDIAHWKAEADANAEAWKKWGDAGAASAEPRAGRRVGHD